MGRWGHRLFEGDQDLDIALEINNAFGTGSAEIPFSHMIHQTDMLAPDEARAYYQTPEYAVELAGIVGFVRQKLDTDGLGDKLFEKYRAKESEDNGKYRLILVGALMMRAGAKIRDADLLHLRELVPLINCNEGYTMPICDDSGFRGPGKRQFLAALDNYKPGVPRSLGEPSCFACGKIQADVGKGLEKCGRCKGAFYCGKDCQKAHWKMHKRSCIDPRNNFSLNV